MNEAVNGMTSSPSVTAATANIVWRMENDFSGVDWFVEDDVVVIGVWFWMCYLIAMYFDFQSISSKKSY